jgi:hypothetical protein
MHRDGDGGRYTSPHMLDANQMIGLPKIPIISSYMYWLSFLPGTVCLRSLPAEEVDVCKLLHLVNITTKGNLLVVEQNPSWILADESNVMTTGCISMVMIDSLVANSPRVNRTALVAHN